MYLLANTLFNFNFFILKIRISIWFRLHREPGDAWEKKGGAERFWWMASYMALFGEDFYIFMACWFLFRDWRTYNISKGGLFIFPCVVFMYWNIVVKIAGWGVMNVFKDLPLKEAFFQPLVVTTHFPVLCTPLSLFIPTKAPCVNLSANVPAQRAKISWDTGPSLLKHQGLPPQMLVGIAQGTTQGWIVKLGICQQCSAWLSELFTVEWVWGWSVGTHTTDSRVMRWQCLSLRLEIKLNWKLSLFTCSCAILINNAGCGLVWAGAVVSAPSEKWGWFWI